MGPAPLSDEARTASWRVFALVLLSASYFFQSTAHNEAARFDQIRAVTEHGEWWIDRFSENTGDVVRVHGHNFPDKSPGTTLVGLIPWTLFRAAFSVFPLTEDQQMVLVTYALTVLMSALPTALTALLMLRYLARSGWTLIQSTVASLGYSLGTIAFPFATLFFGHQLAAFFAFAAFYLIWDSRGGTMTPSPLRLAGAGLLIGFLPLLEYPAAIASGFIGLYSILTLGPRISLPLILGSLAGVLPLPIYNQTAFGSPTSISYTFYLQEGSNFPGFKVSWPRLDALAYITFGPERGLFYANPWLLLMATAPVLAKRVQGASREFWLFASIFIGLLLFNAGYGDTHIYWGGGYSVGPRYLLVALPFAAVLASISLRPRYLGALASTLIVGNILLMLPAAAVEPRLPYEAADPFLSFYGPLYSRANFSTNPKPTFGSPDLFSSSGAFNLGRVLGLPRDLEILPLVTGWAIAVFVLFKASGGRARAAKILVALLVLALGSWPALPRLLSSTEKRSGICRMTSPSRTWRRFFDYATQGEPSPDPRYRVVGSPSILPYEHDLEVASGEASKVAVTFAGHLQPEASEWFVFHIEARGQAALYLDGIKRLEVGDFLHTGETKQARVFLSSSPHELVIRYMSEKGPRLLRVLMGLQGEPLTPLNPWLSTSGC